jgi:ATP-dependent DNA helicase PIF1
MTDSLLYSELVSEVFDNHSNVYISGVGGTGKSFQLKLLYQEAVKRGIKCVLLSTTGVSSFNIGGRTVHSWSGIVFPSYSLDLEENQERFIASIDKKTSLPPYKDRYTDVEIVFIDEVSMLGALYFETLDYIARKRRGTKVGSKLVDSPLSFGGIQLVLTGDMAQLPPVKDGFIFESEVWDDLKLKDFVLMKAYRFDSQEWTDLLARARLGELTQKDKNILKSRLGEASSKCIKFMPLNRDADRLNKKCLDAVEGSATILTAGDSVEVVKGKNRIVKKTIAPIPHEFDKIFIVDGELHLKVSARVMLRFNLNVEEGLTNGSLGVIKNIDLDEQIIYVKFDDNSEVVPIEPIEFVDEDYDADGSILIRTRVQYPLSLAYATSIHKSQSLTFNEIEIDIGSNIFCPGQSYVALSRCRSLSGLRLTIFNSNKVYADPKAIAFEKELNKRATKIY